MNRSPLPCLLVTIFLLMLLAPAQAATPAGPASVHDVRAYGARGDGSSDDGAAIQRAIDACHAAGGGRVLLDGGTFVSGGIVLKSNVDLHLTASATLRSDTDVRKLNQDGRFNFKNTICSFVYASDAENVSISGAGTIDGRGTTFTNHGVYSERPQLVLLRNCRNVRLDDVLLHDSGMFTLWMIQCEGVWIDGIRIRALLNPNNDGITIDGSRKVYISNVDIESVDDCIGLKASDRGHPVSEVVITNSIFSSRCAAIRVGPDAAANIENITVSNCVIRDTGLGGIKIQQVLGVTMRNMTFTNLVMDNVKSPISIRSAGWNMGPYTGLWQSFDDTGWEKGRLQNILFSHITATVPALIAPGPRLAGSPEGWLNLTKLNLGISVTGTPQTRPEGITFSDVEITFAGGGTAEEGARRNLPLLEREYPEVYMFGPMPAYGVYLRHAAGVTLDNVRFRLRGEDLRPALVADRVEDLEVSGFRAAGNTGAEALLRLENCRTVLIDRARPLGPVGIFLRVEGHDSANIRVAAPGAGSYRTLWQPAAGAAKKSVTVTR